jgi:hypothetical protein
MGSEEKPGTGANKGGQIKRPNDESIAGRHAVVNWSPSISLAWRHPATRKRAEEFRNLRWSLSPNETLAKTLARTSWDTSSNGAIFDEECDEVFLETAHFYEVCYEASQSLT